MSAEHGTCTDHELLLAYGAVMAELRKKFVTVTYSHRTTVDYSGGSGYFRCAAAVPDASADLASCTSDAVTHPMFK